MMPEHGACAYVNDYQQPNGFDLISNSGKPG
jgi:hypothetical protein